MERADLNRVGPADGIRVAGDVRADEGGIAAGRDVVADLVVTGNSNTFFSGNYLRLAEAYLDPWWVYQRVNVEAFVGRAWLTEAVDAFLEVHDRGYVILEAKAGLGKTAFLAHLVKQRGWIHHFVEVNPGPDGIIPARLSLAAQVIRTFELDDYGDPPALPLEAASRPDFLGSLLRKASSKRKPGEKIVVAVDALDEAGTRPGENVLGLPPVVPEGVFFVCSRRPVAMELNLECPRVVVTLEAQDPRNVADVEEYLQSVLRTERMMHALARSAPGYSMDQLAEVLQRKTAGVWVYLHHVLAELEQAHEPVDLEGLPKTLWDYYKKFWQTWKQTHATTWRQMDLPFLATLAAVQEPATLRLLSTLAGTGDSFELPDRWRPFLTSEGKGSERRYRLYHASLRDFMEGDIPKETVGEVDQVFAEELKHATVEAHSHIAQRYLDAWGDAAEGLPGLGDPAYRNLDGGYGWRRIARRTSSLQAARRIYTLCSEQRRFLGNLKESPVTQRTGGWKPMTKRTTSPAI